MYAVNEIIPVVLALIWLSVTGALWYFAGWKWALGALVGVMAMFFLAGCAQSISGIKDKIQTDVEFNEVVLEDVRQAKVLAASTNDALAMKCWSYLEEFTIANAPGLETPAGEVVGVFSTYQKARNIRRTIVEVKVSDAFRLECGPMLTDSMGALGRIGIRMSIPLL